jgi:WD40 repeat protein
VTSENGARRWDVATGELQGEYSYPVEFIGAGLPIWQPVFSPDGRRLAIAGAFTKANTFRIGIFDVATGEMEWEVRRTAKAGNDGPPFGLAFSPDGQTLYSCGRRIEAWPLK